MTVTRGSIFGSQFSGERPEQCPETAGAMVIHPQFPLLHYPDFQNLHLAIDNKERSDAGKWVKSDWGTQIKAVSRLRLY